MPVSSRTPEGFPVRCAVCGAESYVEPSLPPGDAVCPRCGQLVWVREAISLYEKLCELYGVAEENLRMDTTLGELGQDSLDIVELVMELEEDLDFDIPAVDAEQLKTVGDLLRYIAERK